MFFLVVFNFLNKGSYNLYFIIGNLILLRYLQDLLNGSFVKAKRLESFQVTKHDQ